MTLTAALETRKSVRRRGAVPPSVNDLGEFLYRVARVRGQYEANGMVCTSRPYPGGGACHELELYLVIDRSAGLAAGIYHYDPIAHALSFLSPPNPLTNQLLHDAWVGCARLCRPDLLIVLSARFGRLSWKYQSIAYATILKDVGVLYQTMYLVATAMGLGPCAIGCGNADLFARAIGTDYYQETSVGEFMLNGRS